MTKKFQKMMLYIMDNGFRNDVIVAIGNKNYKLYITDIERLEQDYYAEIENNDIYSSKPNMIVVRKVTKAEIENTIKHMFNEEFFNDFGYMN